ncbi:hypothetical protein N9O47_02500 [Candidatus Pelagibacter sp.]|nr:hypothetical protein [Candidatus Pelagibacter sp.]
MKIVAIVQARVNSVRFPNKVMKHINGMPIIEIILKRLNKSKLLNQIILATSTDTRNKILVDHVESLGFACIEGSDTDVLNRYIQAAEKTNADIIVRITGDCPLVDPVLVDECIRGFQDSKVDYYSNISPPTFPDGLDIEVINMGKIFLYNWCM